MIMVKRAAKAFVVIIIAAVLMGPIAVPDASAAQSKRVASGLIWVVDKTTHLNSLTIEEGAFVMGTQGHSVTLTVDGVETGILPGTYTGDVVVTLTELNVFKYKELDNQFRQALFLDKSGIVEAKSVLAAAGDYKLKNGTLTDVRITSRGEAFNGIFVAGGTYTIKDAVLDFSGNGGDDFDGYGAAVMAAGKDTRLILDGARIKAQGAVRPGIVATRNSTLIVKNSTIETKDGILPPDYVPNVELGKMRAVPWMLGLSGNSRATNLLGKNTTATYINSSISSERWGVLSADGDDETQEPVEPIDREQKLIAINSSIANTKGVGYGNYFTAYYYGCDIDVGDYASIGGALFAASNPETIAEMNADYNFGLTDEELGALPRKGTHVKSGRFGMMLKGFAKIMDDTVFDTEKAIFLIKGGGANIDVDGSGGAQLNSRNGIIVQIMEDDDPMRINAIYHEPEDPVKADDFDVTVAGDSDMTARFANIELKGDFYNGFPGGKDSGRGGGMPEGMPPGGGMAPDGGMPGGTGGPGGAGGGGPMRGPSSGLNMVLNFENSDVTGIITSSRARHAKPVITSEDYLLLGEVANTPGPAVNNGAIVSLSGSTWTVTGTSYLTAMTISEDSAVKAPAGHKVSMKVNGSEMPVKAGSYTGNIVLSVSEN
jgi:hypothetical protein